MAANGNEQQIFSMENKNGSTEIRINNELKDAALWKLKAGVKAWSDITGAFDLKKTQLEWKRFSPTFQQYAIDLNTEMNKALNWELKGLAWKLGLTTLPEEKIQNDDKKNEARRLTAAQKQTASFAGPSAPRQDAPQTAGIGNLRKYANGNGLEERMKSAWL